MNSTVRLFRLLLVLAAALSPLSGQSLAGKRIVISPGHGYYWHSSLGWIQQRPLIDGLVEDKHTSEIVRDWLVPWLEGAGAQVILCRARSETTAEIIVQNDDGFPAYQESGVWFTSVSTGWANTTYRYAFTDLQGAHRATYSASIPTTDEYPVYLAFREGTNRTAEARVEVGHAGGTSVRTVNQKIDGLRWVYVGTFPFRAGETATVTLSSQASITGDVVIADAVRIGDGFGSIARGGSTSGQPRWRECSRYHAQYFGAPPSVWNPVAGGQDNSDDVTCRPRYAEWWGADLFLSLHTNAGGGTGTSSFIYNGGATAGSASFQGILQNRLVTDIRLFWDPTWVDRGAMQANFGEVRLLQTMPGCLVELAFHDDIGGDIEAIHHPDFRYISGRALYRSIASYLAPGQPWAPEAPTAVALQNIGGGDLRLSWNFTGGASGFRVSLSDDGFGWDDGQDVTGTSLVISGRTPGSTLYARVASTNSGGQGPWSTPVGARLGFGGASPLLLVDGFDRRDRSLKRQQNPRAWLGVVGPMVEAAVAAGYPFDGATNEAVSASIVPLAPYRCVGWILGEESTTDESFSSPEQIRIDAYLQGGGRFFFSGAEVGWDLDQLGNVADRQFYEFTLGQDYVADDAGVYVTQASAGGPLGVLPALAFSNGTNGLYDVDFPDVVQPSFGTNGQIVLRYITGQGAAVLHDNGRALGFGFPLESIVDPAQRNLLMERVLELMCPLPLGPGGTPMPGQVLPLQLDFPQRGGELYLAAASGGIAPGIDLGGGLLLPLIADPILSFSLDPSQSVFTGMTGTLDLQGQAQAQVLMPAVPALAGTPIYFSALTLDSSQPAFTEVAPWIRILLP